MGIELITERHAAQIEGVLGCWDRILVFGTLPKICYAGGMTSYLYEHQVKIFDYPRFAEPFRNQLQENAERLAAQNGLEIEFLRKRNVRKEDRVKEILDKRGDQPGLVCIFSAMEPCSTYQPWHNKQTGKTYLLPDDGKCLHYYFYFVDQELGLCYVRVPAWLPCRLQIYCNGHNWLASQLRKRKIDYQLLDNAFVQIGTGNSHSRSSTIYENLARTAIHTVKPDNIATFLGRKLSTEYQGEMGNRFNIRIEGTRIKHTMGPVSLKLYDKFGRILRIETTVNDLTFFKHYREVEHRDGTREIKWASMQKTIYSLPALRELLEAANRRYLEFLSTLTDPRAGRDKLDKLSRTVQQHGRSYPGFNLFDSDDDTLFRAILRGEFNIRGLQNKTLRHHLPEKNSGQVSRLLKRLRIHGLIKHPWPHQASMASSSIHGLIKKVGRTYKYYLTQFGKEVIATRLKLRELVIIPQLAFGHLA